jgi:hypothetical protein
MTLRRFFVASIVLCNLATCLAETPEPKAAFLLERKTITTNAGVIDLAAGTRVVIIARHGDMLTVKANDQEFEIPESQVAADAQPATTPTEREQQEILERQTAEAEVRYKEALLKQQKEVEESAKARKPEAGKVHQREEGMRRKRELEEIRGKRELLKIELDKVKLEQKELPQATSSDVARSSPTALKLQQRRKEIERDLAGLDQQERLLKAQSP